MAQEAVVEVAVSDEDGEEVTVAVAVVHEVVQEEPRDWLPPPLLLLQHEVVDDGVDCSEDVDEGGDEDEGTSLCNISSSFDPLFRPGWIKM